MIRYCDECGRPIGDGSLYYSRAGVSLHIRCARSRGIAL